MNTRFPFGPSRRAVLLAAALAAAVGGGTGLTEVALAAGGKATTKTSRRSTRLHVQRAAHTASTGAPEGAALKFSADGEAIYSERRSASLTNAAASNGSSASGETLCMEWRQTSEAGPPGFTSFTDVSCGSAAQVEAEGIVKISGSNGKMQAVAILLPSGVTSVTATESNGASHAVPAPSGAVIMKDSAVTSVTYTLANGAPHVTNLASSAG